MTVSSQLYIHYVFSIMFALFSTWSCRVEALEISTIIFITSGFCFEIYAHALRNTCKHVHTHTHMHARTTTTTTTTTFVVYLSCTAKWGYWVFSKETQQIQAHYMKSVIGAGLRPQFTVRLTPPGTHTMHLAALRHFVSYAEQQWTCPTGDQAWLIILAWSDWLCARVHIL